MVHDPLYADLWRAGNRSGWLQGLLLVCTGAWGIGLSDVSEAQTVRSDLYVTNGAVTAEVLDGNTLYVAGAFTAIGPATGGGVPLDGASGSPAANFPKVTGTVNAVIADGAGGWYIAGNFIAVGGVPRSNMAHILADMSLADWNPHPDGAVNTMVLSGTTLYAGGEFVLMGDELRMGIAAVDAISGLVTSWDPNAGGGPNSLYVLAVNGGTVYAGGSFTNIGGASRNNIAALDATTGLATAWNPNASGPVNALAVDGGTVYAGGSFSSIGGQPRNRIAALDGTTGLATAWDPKVSTLGRVLALALDGQTVYVGGTFTAIGGQARNRIAAVETVTGTVTSWNPNVGGNVNALAVDGGTVYVGGSFTTIDGSPRNRIAALDAATGLAMAWDPNAGGTVNALAISDRTVYAGGSFTTLGAVDRSHLAALDVASGTPTAWSPVDVGSVNALAVGGGTVYVAGVFKTPDGPFRFGIEAVDAATGLANWEVNVNSIPLGSRILALALDGGTIYAGGTFTMIGGQPRNRIAAIDTDAGLVTSWDPNASGPVNALAVDGGTVYAGGSFSSIGGQPRKRVAALNAATGLATTWDANADSTVRVLVANGGTLYAAGVGSSRVDLQACKLEYSIVSPK